MDLLPDTGDQLDYDSTNEGLALFMDDDDELIEPVDSGSKKGIDAYIARRRDSTYPP